MRSIHFAPLPLIIPVIGLTAGLSLALLFRPFANQKVEIIPESIQEASVNPVLPSPTSTPSTMPSSTKQGGVEVIPPDVQQIPVEVLPGGKGATTEQVPNPSPTPDQSQGTEVGIPGVPGMSIRSSRDSSYSFHTVIGVVPINTEVTVDGRPAVITICPDGEGGSWGRIQSPISYHPGNDPEYYSDSPTGAKEGWIDLCGVQFKSKKMW